MIRTEDRAATLEAVFRVMFMLYGKKVKILSKKVAAVAST